MRIHNVYTDATGESHFRETQAEHNLDWHPARAGSTS